MENMENQEIQLNFILSAEVHSAVIQMVLILKGQKKTQAKQSRGNQKIQFSPFLPFVLFKSSKESMGTTNPEDSLHQPLLTQRNT